MNGTESKSVFQILAELKEYPSNEQVIVAEELYEELLQTIPFRCGLVKPIPFSLFSWYIDTHTKTKDEFAM